MTTIQMADRAEARSAPGRAGGLARLVRATIAHLRSVADLFDASTLEEAGIEPQALDILAIYGASYSPAAGLWGAEGARKRVRSDATFADRDLPPGAGPWTW